MKSKTLRLITALAVIVIITIGFATHFGIGTLSAIGWSEISLLCPLGALGTMLATKMMVPRAVISLVFAILFIIVLGRAFCAWACPVPLVQKVRTVFARKPSKQVEKDLVTPNSELSAEASKTEKVSDKNSTETAETIRPDAAVASSASLATKAKESIPLGTQLSDDEKKALAGCASSGATSAGCASSDCKSCAEKRGSVDSRHFILGGSLLSAAIFGFPVFCLVCPIGLSFATILLLVRLFSNGDVTWSLIVVPLILIVEVVLFKKWCHKLCPLSAFMSLIGKANRTFKPTINDSKCIETSKGKECGVCAKVCTEGINPRHHARGASWSECTKCRDCVDSCPASAITMPLLPPKKETKPLVTKLEPTIETKEQRR